MAAQEVYRIEIPIVVDDQTARVLQQAGVRVSKFEKQVERARKQVEKISRTRWQVVMDAVDRATPVIDKIASRAQSVASKSYSMTVRVLDYATRPLRAISNMATSTLAILGGVGGVGAVTWATKLADDLEVTRVGFETMLKSAQKAEQFMAEVRKFARDTPFGQREVVDLARALLVRGFNENEIIPMLERIGDVAAAMGTGAEGIDRIIYALGQMRALGKVSAEEMNQLTDAGVMAWHYLAQGMGKSIKEVRKLSEEGKISADEAIKHILKGMEEYSGMMQKVSDRTIRGLLGQITDVFEMNIFTEWGNGIKKVAVPALQELRDWFDRNEQVTKAWAKAVEEAGSAVTQFVVNGIRWIMKEMSDLVNSKEWKEASGPFEKLSLIFDRLTVPIKKWWKESGREQIEYIAEQIGSAIGGGLGAFLSSIFGREVESEGNVFAQAGASAGKKFLEGFMKEFHVGEIVKGLLGMFKDIQPSFLGGKTDSLIGSVAALAFDVWVLSRLKNLLRGPFSMGKTVFTKGRSVWRDVLAWGRDARTGGLTGNLRGSPISPVDPRRPPIPTWMTLPGRMWGRVRGVFRWRRRGRAPVAGFASGIPGLNVMNLMSLMGTPGEQMPEALGGVIGSALGGMLGSFIPGVGTMIGSMAGGFLGSKVGGALGGLAGQGGILSALDSLKNQVATKFSELKESAIEGLQGLPGAVGEQFSYVLSTVGSYMSQLPGLVGSWAAQTFNSIVSWFSNLPSNVSTWWAGVYSAISSWAQMAYNSVATWIGNIPSAIQSAFQRAQEIWGNVRTWISEKIGQIRDRLAGGGRESARKYAQGGLISRPHLGIVGEAGPEMIIPLSPSRRNRGLDLWMRTADYLGIHGWMIGQAQRYANGGPIPEPTALVSLRTGKPYAIAGEAGPEYVVPDQKMTRMNGGITVQGPLVKVDFHGDIHGIEDLDKAAYEIGIKLREAIANMP